MFSFRKIQSRKHVLHFESAQFVQTITKSVMKWKFCQHKPDHVRNRLVSYAFSRNFNIDSWRPLITVIWNIHIYIHVHHTFTSFQIVFRVSLELHDCFCHLFWWGNVLRFERCVPGSEHHKNTQNGPWEQKFHKIIKFSGQLVPGLILLWIVNLSQCAKWTNAERFL